MGITKPPAFFTEFYLIDAVFDLEHPAITSIARRDMFRPVFVFGRLLDNFQIRMQRQHMIMHARYPVAARAHLAVRHGRQKFTELCTESLEDILRCIHWYTADEEEFLAHVVSFFVSQCHPGWLWAIRDNNKLVGSVSLFERN